MLDELAASSPAEYGKRRGKSAKKIGIPATILDDEIRRRHAKARADDKTGGGSPVVCANCDPWPEPVPGPELLNQLSTTFTRYIVLPECAATALALWTIHTHALDAFFVSPILAFGSPEKRCGKPLSQAQLARLLRRFQINSKTIRLGTGKTPKGYEHNQFEDAFFRYLPQGGGVQSATPPQVNESGGFSDFQSATEDPDVALRNPGKPNESGGCGGVAFQKRVSGGKEDIRSSQTDQTDTDGGAEWTS